MWILGSHAVSPPLSAPSGLNPVHGEQGAQVPSTGKSMRNRRRETLPVLPFLILLHSGKGPRLLRLERDVQFMVLPLLCTLSPFFLGSFTYSSSVFTGSLIQIRAARADAAWPGILVPGCSVFSDPSGPLIWASLPTCGSSFCSRPLKAGRVFSPSQHPQGHALISRSGSGTDLQITRPMFFTSHHCLPWEVHWYERHCLGQCSGASRDTSCRKCFLRCTDHFHKVWCPPHQEAFQKSHLLLPNPNYSWNAHLEQILWFPYAVKTGPEGKLSWLSINQVVVISRHAMRCPPKSPDDQGSPSKA